MGWNIFIIKNIIIHLQQFSTKGTTLIHCQSTG